MNILIVGGGGREHAIAWAASKSEYVEKIYVAPGNAGMQDIAELVNIQDKDVRSLASFAERKSIDLTIVGPETPLALGITDYFQKRNLRIFGPSQEAAKIEASKIFSKTFMREHNIPTASFKSFTDAELAIKFLETRDFPIVIKTDGLAAGKGVIIAHNLEEAKDAILHMMIEQNFGNAGKKVVIEEFLKGPEMSFLAITDGKNIIPLVTSMDYKKLGESNTGPNTGGMGTIAPHPMLTKEIESFVMEHIMHRTVDGLRKIGKPFIGVLYAGLVLTDNGPKVLEFNCRFGDPETQVIIPLLKSDFIEMLLYTIEGKLDEYEPEWYNKKAICVVMASGGYPKRYKKGYEITGIKDVPDGVTVFQAGTTSKGDSLVTNGGRVLGVTGLGDNFNDARTKVYTGVKMINFNKSIYRSDIGKAFIKL